MLGDASKDLTIEAYMKPNADGGGNHYCMLLDDFTLSYESGEILTRNTSAVLDDVIHHEVLEVGNPCSQPCRRHASPVARWQKAQSDGMHVQLRSDFGQVVRLE